MSKRNKDRVMTMPEIVAAEQEALQPEEQPQEPIVQLHMLEPSGIHRVRIECLKVAMERVTANKPPRSIIGEAQEFEAYVLGTDADE